MKLVRYVHALCPAQKIDEYTADAWHRVLGSYELDECINAADRIKRGGGPYVDPGEIITLIEREAVLQRHEERIRAEHEAYLEPLRQRREGSDPRPLRETIDEIRRQFGFGPPPPPAQ